MMKIAGMASVSFSLLWMVGCSTPVRHVAKESAAWPVTLGVAVAEDATRVTDPLAEKMAVAPRVQIVLPKDEDLAAVVKTLEENCKRHNSDSRKSYVVRPPTQEELKGQLEKEVRLIRERATFAGLRIVDDDGADYRVELVMTAERTHGRISAACVQVATGKRHTVYQDEGHEVSIRNLLSPMRQDERHETFIRKLLSPIPLPCALVEETRGGGRFAKLGRGRFRNNEVVAVYTHKGGAEVEVGHGLVVKHDAKTAWLEIYNYRQAGVRAGCYVK